MEINDGAQKIVGTCLDIKEGESVLIVSDPYSPSSVNEALFKASENRGASASVLVMPSAKLPGEEPGKVVAAAIEAADVIIATTSQTIGHSSCLQRALQGGARAVVLTGCDEATFQRGGIEADFKALHEVVNYVKERFNQAKEVEVISPGGTSLRLSVEGRQARACTGLCHHPGEMTGFPDVEVYIAPVENSTCGKLVVDASCSSLGLVRKPVSIDIKDGRVTKISGGPEAEKINKILDEAGDDNVYVIGEFAIGLNPCSEVTGNIIEDEGKYGTGHFCLGNNINFGGKNWAPIHLDLVYWRPTISLDNQPFMKGGVICKNIS